MVEASRSYFNFLLNRPLNDSIVLEMAAPALPLVSLEDAQQSAVNNREEMSQINNYIQLNEHVLRLQQGNNTPDLFGAVDYGFQGEEYSFQADDDFVLASLVLQWTLFHGLTNRNKVKQTRIEVEKLQLSLEEAEEQIKMQVVNQYYAVITSHEAIEAASNQLRLTRKAFRITERKYAEGQASLLEYIDARTSFTTAQSNLIIAKNDYSIQLAELEFAMAGADFNLYQ